MAYQVVTGRTPDQDGRVSIATVRELAIVELFSQKEKNINSASLPSSPTGAGAVPYPNPPPLQMEQSSSPYAGASQPFNLSQNRSPGQPHKTERQEHDFLAPPRQNSISSNGGGSGANLAAASRQTASPGLWGRPDPVDELLLSYHRAKGDSVAESNMLQGQLQQAGVGGTSSGRPAASDSAWSAKAIGMGDHKFNQPFAQSPHSLASPQTRPLQPAQGLTFQQASYSLSPLASTATSRSQQPTSPSLGGGGTNGGGNANTSADGVFGGGLGGTAFDQMDFTSPWTHGVHAFTGATGVVGSTESPEAGDGFGDLLGDAKEIAFLVRHNALLLSLHGRLTLPPFTLVIHLYRISSSARFHLATGQVSDVSLNRSHAVMSWHMREHSEQHRHQIASALRLSTN